MKNYFFDMDGTLALYHRWVYTSTKEEPWWAKIAGTHYYATLPPYTKMVEFVRQRLQEHPQSVYILTSIGVTEAAAYPMCRKTPCFSYGDIRHFHRIYVSN